MTVTDDFVYSGASESSSGGLWCFVERVHPRGRSGDESLGDQLGEMLRSIYRVAHISDAPASLRRLLDALEAEN